MATSVGSDVVAGGGISRLTPAARHDPDDIAILHQELAALPDKYRLPVLLCFVEGLSHADAAERLGWPVGTVAGRIGRAKDTLRVRLARRGLAPSLAALAVAGGNGPFAVATSRAAVAFAAGEATAVSPAVLTLTHGAIRAMTLAKLKLVAGLVAACGALTAGGVWAGGHQMGAGGPPGGAGGIERPPAAAAAPPPKIERLKVDPKAPNPGRPEDPKRMADYAARRQSIKNLKQLLVAWHNASDTYSRMPGNVVGKDGKPLLSWRVQLLPYLEQEELYKQFKLDEPWHSPNNKPLLAKMPDMYRTAFQAKDATYTYYQGFAGPDTVFEPGRPLSIVAIRDGTSNTLAIAEVGTPVPWTQPVDVPYDPAAKFPAVAWPFANVLNLGLADGSCHHVSPLIGEQHLRRLIETDDGQNVPSFSDLKPAFPEEAAEEQAAAQRVLAENLALLDKIAGLMKEYTELIQGQPFAASPDRLEAIRTHLRLLAEQLAERNERLKGATPAKK